MPGVQGGRARKGLAAHRRVGVFEVAHDLLQPRLDLHVLVAGVQGVQDPVVAELLELLEGGLPQGVLHYYEVPGLGPDVRTKLGDFKR